MERRVSPLRAHVAQNKIKRYTAEEWKKADADAKLIFREALRDQLRLAVPGSQVNRFVLETDWSSGFAGYLLFAQVSGVDGRKEVLVDVGSCVLREKTSSFLGEFRAVVWACKRTKRYRGDVEVTIRTDNLALCEKLKVGGLGATDVREMRLWGWMMANESNFATEFVPGSENVGADLLSRPVRANALRKANSLSEAEWKLIHEGHPSVRGTMMRAKAYGLGIKKSEIEAMIARCRSCQAFAPLHSRSPLKSVLDAAFPGEFLSVDFIGALPKSGSFQFVFVISDSLSRLMQATAVTAATSANAIKELKLWITAHGSFQGIMCDNATAFTSRTFRDWTRSLNIKLVYAPAVTTNDVVSPYWVTPAEGLIVGRTEKSLRARG
ncbi:MAG: hypothetical protein Aurels2KO_58480 [Aureliella sp.]